MLSPDEQHREGFILLIVLIVVLLLIGLALTLIISAEAERSISRNYALSIQAFYAAEAGTQAAMEAFEHDLELDDRQWANRWLVIPEPVGSYPAGLVVQDVDGRITGRPLQWVVNLAYPYDPDPARDRDAPFPSRQVYWLSEHDENRNGTPDLNEILPWTGPDLETGTYRIGIRSLYPAGDPHGAPSADRMTVVSKGFSKTGVKSPLAREHPRPSVRVLAVSISGETQAIWNNAIVSGSGGYDEPVVGGDYTVFGSSLHFNQDPAKTVMAFSRPGTGVANSYSPYRFGFLPVYRVDGIDPFWLGSRTYQRMCESCKGSPPGPPTCVYSQDHIEFPIETSPESLDATIRMTSGVIRLRNPRATLGRPEILENQPYPYPPRNTIKNTLSGIYGNVSIRLEGDATLRNINADVISTFDFNHPDFRFYDLEAPFQESVTRIRYDSYLQYLHNDNYVNLDDQNLRPGIWALDLTGIGKGGGRYDVDELSAIVLIPDDVQSLGNYFITNGLSANSFTMFDWERKILLGRLMSAFQQETAYLRDTVRPDRYGIHLDNRSSFHAVGDTRARFSGFDSMAFALMVDALKGPGESLLYRNNIARAPMIYKKNGLRLRLLIHLEDRTFDPRRCTACINPWSNTGGDQNSHNSRRGDRWFGVEMDEDWDGSIKMLGLPWKDGDPLPHQYRNDPAWDDDPMDDRYDVYENFEAGPREIFVGDLPSFCPPPPDPPCSSETLSFVFRPPSAGDPGFWKNDPRNAPTGMFALMLYVPGDDPLTEGELDGSPIKRPVWYEYDSGKYAKDSDPDRYTPWGLVHALIYSPPDVCVARDIPGLEGWNLQHALEPGAAQSPYGAPFIKTQIPPRLNWGCQHLVDCYVINECNLRMEPYSRPSNENHFNHLEREYFLSNFSRPDEPAFEGCPGFTGYHIDSAATEVKANKGEPSRFALRYDGFNELLGDPPPQGFERRNNPSRRTLAGGFGSLRAHGVIMTGSGGITFGSPDPLYTNATVTDGRCVFVSCTSGNTVEEWERGNPDGTATGDVVFYDHVVPLGRFGCEDFTATIAYEDTYVRSAIPSPEEPEVMPVRTLVAMFSFSGDLLKVDNKNGASLLGSWIADRMNLGGVKEPTEVIGVDYVLANECDSPYLPARRKFGMVKTESFTEYSQ
ncbi:PilX N-terminal domain-containing pilus assembly protein [Acidobacteriota bacterium]